MEGKTIQIPDVLADPEYHAMDYQQAFGYRTILGVPLLRDGKTIVNTPEAIANIGISVKEVY